MSIIQPITYLPYYKRPTESEYPNLLKRLVTQGVQSKAARQKAEILEHTCQVMRFDMKNGFPVTSLRKISKKMFEGSLGEIIAFINGARTLDEFVSFGGNKHWWKNWVTPEKCKVFGLAPGDLGTGSYGPALAARIKNGKRFNQIEVMLKQMKAYPLGRTNLLTTWYPEYDIGTEDDPREVVVAPCHGTVVLFKIREEDGVIKMKMIHVQRSADEPVGLVFNMIEYPAVGMMVAYLNGFEFTEYEHVILDGHLYRNFEYINRKEEEKIGDQYEKVKTLLSRQPRRPPTVTLAESVRDEVKTIFDFRPHHFILSEYEPHEGMFIPTPI